MLLLSCDLSNFYFGFIVIVIILEDMVSFQCALEQGWELQPSLSILGRNNPLEV